MTRNSPSSGIAPRKHEEIAESLTRDILVGQYRTGERLPSERDLALRFEANRGAVREAMKKLEQLGLASIHQGGARVCPVQDASLDVISHLLALGDLPDEDLVDEIMQVLAALITLAAEATVRRGSDEQVADIRARLRPLMTPTLDPENMSVARFELMHAIMLASGNLVCQIIARSLFLQLVPRVAPLEAYAEPDTSALSDFAQRLDAALAARDLEAIRPVFETMTRFNRDVARRAFAASRIRSHASSHPSSRASSQTEQSS